MARCRESERLHVDVGADGRHHVTDRFGKVQHQWYYRAGERTVGPLSPWAMRMAMRAGELSPDSRVCRDDGSRWRRAWDCDELFEDEDRVAYRVNFVCEHHESTWQPEHLHG